MWSFADPAERGGFALLEALVALVVIGTFGVAVLATLGAQVRTADRAATLLVAQALAEDRQMALELLDYADLVNLPAEVAAGTFEPPFENFSWSARVEAVEDEADLFATEILISDGSLALPMQGMIHRSGATLVVGAAP